MSAHTPGPVTTKLQDRAAWIRREINGGGSFEHLSAREQECTYIAHTFVMPLEASHAELLSLARQYASECGECGGTGVHPCIVGNHTPQAGVGEEPCPDCADIRAAIAKATGAQS